MHRIPILRLRDGTRAYVHGVIDNYSRRIMGWVVESELRAETTRTMLLEVRGRVASIATVNVMTDGGPENVALGGGAVPGIAEHVIAQVGIHFSNSMVEAFWRQLRHQWLYLHSLESVASLRELVGKYVADHNALIPRVEFGGRTPDEAHAGLEADLEPRLQSAYAAAMKVRFEANRERSCAACAPPVRAGQDVRIRCTDRWSVRLAPGSRCAGDLDELSPTHAARPRLAA